jgi:hypothetical protein
LFSQKTLFIPSKIDKKDLNKKKRKKKEKKRKEKKEKKKEIVRKRKTVFLSQNLSYVRRFWLQLKEN